MWSPGVGLTVRFPRGVSLGYFWWPCWLSSVHPSITHEVGSLVSLHILYLCGPLPLQTWCYDCERFRQITVCMTEVHKGPIYKSRQWTVGFRQSEQRGSSLIAHLSQCLPFKVLMCVLFFFILTTFYSVTDLANRCTTLIVTMHRVCNNL